MLNTWSSSSRQAELSAMTTRLSTDWLSCQWWDQDLINCWKVFWFLSSIVNWRLSSWMRCYRNIMTLLRWKWCNVFVLIQEPINLVNQETLEKMLCDHLVTEIMDDGIQKKLLAEPKLTYKRALEIAQGCEEAEKNLGVGRDPRRVRDSVSANFSKDTIQKLTSARTLELHMLLLWEAWT